MKYADVHRQIAEIASQYQYHKVPDVVIDLQELFRKLLRWLFDLLPSLHISAPSAGTDSRMASDLMHKSLIAAGVVAGVVILVTIWFRLKSIIKQTDIARTGAFAQGRELSHAGWKEEAQKLAQEGNFRFASRATYLSFLRLLDENQILKYSPTKTNYEYWYSLSSKEDLRKPFRTLMDTVEEIWFGEKQADSVDYERCFKCLTIAENIVEKTKSQIPATAGKESSDH